VEEPFSAGEKVSRFLVFSGVIGVSARFSGSASGGPLLGGLRPGRNRVSHKSGEEARS
jgi:hypothetical protein